MEPWSFDGILKGAVGGCPRRKCQIFPKALRTSVCMSLRIRDETPIHSELLFRMGLEAKNSYSIGRALDSEGIVPYNSLPLPKVFVSETLVFLGTPPSQGDSFCVGDGPPLTASS